MKRHPELSLQEGDCTSQTCMKAMSNKTASEQYFFHLEGMHGETRINKQTSPNLQF